MQCQAAFVQSSMIAVKCIAHAGSIAQYVDRSSLKISRWRARGNAPLVASGPCIYTSFTFFSGRLRTGLPVAAAIALSTAGDTTQIVGSPTPPQKS